MKKKALKKLQELQEPMIDFLHRLKDKHPSCTSFILIFDFIADGESFDVALRVMDFMRDNNLKPSDKLVEEYRQSKTTKTLNRFPSYVELKEKIGMEEWRYDNLKKTYRRKIVKYSWNNFIIIVLV